jgi:hypothetical protein
MIVCSNAGVYGVVVGAILFFSLQVVAFIAGVIGRRHTRGRIGMMIPAVVLLGGIITVVVVCISEIAFPPSIDAAASEGRVDVVANQLKSNPALVNTVDAEVRTLLYWGVRRGDRNLVALLLANKGNVNGMFECGILARSTFEIKLGGRVYDTNEYSIVRMTPLHLAVLLDRQDIVELLLTKGADVNARTEPTRKWRKVVQSEKNDRNAALLNEDGKMPLVPSDVEWTPLHYAAYCGNAKVAEALLSKGADPKAGRVTPLDVAATADDSFDRRAVLRVLQDHIAVKQESDK